MARTRKRSDRNLELVDALATLERDRGMPAETIYGALEDALAAAYPKTPGVAATHARVEIDRESGEIRVFEREVDEETEEVLSETPVETTPEFGRIAAQTAKQVIHERLREAERQMAFEEYEDREGEVVTGIVEQHDPRFVILNLGKAEAIMPHSEQIPRERYEVGDRVRGYICEVREGRGPTIVVSRSHPGLVRKLFEMEVPEISDGLVEIKAIAREAGHRTKVAVISHDSTIAPLAPTRITEGTGISPPGQRSSASPSPQRYQSTCSRTASCRAAAASGVSGSAGRKLGSKTTVAPCFLARRATSRTSSRALSEIAIVIPVRWTTCTSASAPSGTSPTRSREAAEPARR